MVNLFFLLIAHLGKNILFDYFYQSGRLENRCYWFFPQVTDGVLCINPGHVSRGDAPGSYAVIRIHECESKSVDNCTPLTTHPWSIVNRSSVHVYRL